MRERTKSTKQYEVLASWPHDDHAFTEGLRFYNGLLYESVGLCKSSGLRRVDLRTGKIVKEVLLDAVCKGEDCSGKDCFAEGLTVMNGLVFQLTWTSQKGFIYDAKDLRPRGTFCYSGEGWGLTNDGRSLILSNGSSQIQFLDPITFQIVETIDVTYNSKPFTDLNELEYVNGEIYANAYNGTFGDCIVRIDPSSGKVLKVVDLTELCRPYKRNGVLNGIAYDEKQDRLLVTGKKWPRLFEIRLR